MPLRIFKALTGQFSGFSVKKYFLENWWNFSRHFLHIASTKSPLKDGIGVISGKTQIPQLFVIFRTTGPQGAKKFPHAFFENFFLKMLSSSRGVQKTQVYVSTTFPHWATLGQKLRFYPYLGNAGNFPSL
jgi:hypothetical protein